MCGILGEFNNNRGFNDLHRKGFLTESLMAGTFRGYDSTGVLAVKHSDPNDVFIFKKALAGYDFVQTKQYLKFLSSIPSYRFIVGHNRWATKGGISAATAHPFQHGNISMVHNGTLKYWSNLNTKDKYDVDSEAICASLNENGVENTINKLDGAYALVWYDQDKKKMYMVRNKERPLYYATIKGSDTIIFASEHKMLSWIGTRNNYDIDKIYDVKVDTLYEFDKDLENTVVKTPVTPYKAPVTIYNNPNKFASFDKKVERGLKRLGLTKGNYIEVVVDRWERYNAKGHTGCHICSDIHGLAVEFRVHATTKKEFDKGDVLSGEISSLIASQVKGREDQVVLNNVYDSGLNKEEYLAWELEQEEKSSKK